MENHTATIPVLVLVAIVSLCYLYRLYHGTQSSDIEPPTVYPRVPLVGHVWNMVWGRFEYFVKLRDENPLPIYRLAIPRVNIYIINSYELIGAIDRRPKNFSFKPIEAQVGKRMTDWSDDAGKIVLRNLNGEDGEWGISIESYQAIRNAMAPGANLDRMNRAMIQDIATSCDRLQPDIQKGLPARKIGLMEWLRHELTAAMTNAVYGPQNPYQDPRVERAFWNYVRDLRMLYIDIKPKITARKGYRGRQAITTAFIKYYRQRSHENASSFTKDRFEVSTKHGVSIEDVAKFECGQSIAVLVNTVPAVFWMIYYIYSNNTILEELRQELSTIVLGANDGDKVQRVDISQIKTSCPILISTFQEVLRHRSMGISIRQVMEDTILNGKYLLKKDGMVQMPSWVIHTDPEIWGPDVRQFKHKRFLRHSETTKRGADGRRFNPAALLAFGNGHSLCPGRHFATTEIMAAVIMFLLRYEVRPALGAWKAPTCANTNIAATIMEPDLDIPVIVEPRVGTEGVMWSFSLADSKTAYGIAEDIS